MAKPASPAPLEIEAKLLAPHPADLRAIARLPRLGPYRLRARGTTRLHSRYLDTPELTLARHGVALRLRRDGRRWELTAKWAGQVTGLMHERRELTIPLGAEPVLPLTLPRGPLREQLTALVAGRPLSPILLTRIQRQRFDVLAAGETDPIAELALDRVYLGPPISQPGLGATYCEVEIELRRGPASAVAELADQLQREFDLLPSPASKFARGVTLLHGAAVLQAAIPAVVQANDSVADALSKIIGEQLRNLRAHDPATRLGADPEALHLWRVALRRLRAVVRQFDTAIPARQRASLTRDFAWLGETSSRVRDLDVQIEHIDRYREIAPADQRAGLGALQAYLRTERTQQRAHLLKLLDSARYLHLLLRLERLVSRPATRSLTPAAAREPIAIVGRRALGDAVRRLHQRHRKLGKPPSAEGLHALRISAKRLRYLLEFLHDMTGKRGRRLVKRLVQLQDALGRHHDAVVASARVRAYAFGAGASADAEVLVGLGVFMGHQQLQAQRACADFEAAWRRFSRKRTAKDLEELRHRLSSQRAAAMRAEHPSDASPDSPERPAVQ